MNSQQKALLVRLREMIEETRESGALNAAGATIVVNRFSRAIETLSDDGPGLVEYVRSKVHEPFSDTYNALIKAGRPDLTAEALVADPDAPWTSEFTDDDRAAACSRLAAHGPRHGLVRKVRRQAIEGIKAAVGWLRKYQYWLWWYAGVALGSWVVYRFITTGPPPPPLTPPPEFSFQAPSTPADIPPSFPLVPLAVIGVLLTARYIWVAFTPHALILKAFHLVLVVVWLVFSFSLIYYQDGNEQAPLHTDYPAFGHPLSKNEALYFTVGILTTAGTGDLSPKTDPARTAVTVQMTLDVLVLVIGIAGVVQKSPARLPARPPSRPVGRV